MAIIPCLGIILESVTTLVRLASSLMRAAFRTVFFFIPFPYKSISEDVILITGGGKGLGRLLSFEFAKHQPKQIIIWGRHADVLQATCKAVKLQDVKCDFMVCDVSNCEEVLEKAKEVEEKYGEVTMLVNNAAVVYGNTILDSSPKDMKHTIDVNTLGSLWTIKAFLPSMMNKNRGHIVLINSMLGLMGLSGAADYVCSKHAMSGFHDTLCMELDKENKTGVKVTSIHPYMVNTDMFTGVTIRFPCLFPFLDKDYVAWKTVDAVLTNQDRLLMPRIMYFLYLVKCIIPLESLLIIQRFTGVHTAMDSFHGRQRLVKQE